MSVDGVTLKQLFPLGVNDLKGLEFKYQRQSK